MRLSFTEIINTETNKPKAAKMRLYGQIGYAFNGDDFAKEMLSLKENGVEKITIVINSVGGNVPQGFSIINAMQELEREGVTVYTLNIGVAFSMAGVILAAAKAGQRDSLDYANQMIHDPSFAGDPKNVPESKKEMLQKTKESLRTILSNSSGLNIEIIASMMEKETTLNAKEAKKNGLIDNIINTSIKPKLSAEMSNYSQMVACASFYDNKKDSNKHIINANKKAMELNNLLGLNVEASESAQIEAVKALKEKSQKALEMENKAIALKSEYSALEKKYTEIEEKLARSEAEKMVNTAIENGQIKADTKELWITNAVNDPTTTQKMLNSFEVVNLNGARKNEQKSGDAEMTIKEAKEVIATFQALSSEEMDNMTELEYLKLDKAFDLTR